MRERYKAVSQTESQLWGPQAWEPNITGEGGTIHVQSIYRVHDAGGGGEGAGGLVWEWERQDAPYSV